MNKLMSPKILLYYVSPIGYAKKLMAPTCCATKLMYPKFLLYHGG